MVYIRIKKLSKKKIGILSSNPLPLRINFVWTLIGNSVYAGCQWGILIVLAKFGTPEMVGQFALGLAITGPVVLFTNLGLRAVQVTDARSEYQFGHYLAVRLLTCVAALVVIIVIVWWSGYRGQMAWIILMVGMAKVIEAVSDVFHGLLQRHERMDKVARSLMVKGPLSLVALAFGVWQTGEVLGGLLGLLSAWALVLLVYDLPNGIRLISLKTNGFPISIRLGANFKKIYPRWEWQKLVSLAWLALPLGLVAMLISLNSNIPRYFIESALGTRELGIYAALVSLMTAGGMIISALDKSVTPRQANYFANGNRKALIMLLAKLFLFAAFLGVMGIMVAWLGGRELLILIFCHEYAEHTDILVMLMIAAAFSYMNFFLGSCMTAARYFRIQLPLFLAINAAVIFFCFIFIQRYGLWGAAFAVTLTQLVQMVLSAIVVFQAIKRLA